MICSTAALSKADVQLAELYKDVLAVASNKDDVRREQLDRLRIQRNVCEDVACMLKVYETRILHLKSSQTKMSGAAED